MKNFCLKGTDGKELVRRVTINNSIHTLHALPNVIKRGKFQNNFLSATETRITTMTDYSPHFYDKCH